MKPGPIHGLLFGVLIIVSMVVIVYWKTPPFETKNLLTLFILLFCLERSWENFFTSKEKDRLVFGGDWSLLVVSITFMGTLFASFMEFYWKAVPVDPAISSLGAVLFFAAMAIRFWAMKTLGMQWGVHIVGQNKRRTSLKIIHAGPYRHIRHPIYVGAIFEAIAVTLMLNTYYSTVFVLLGFVPWELYRARLEERELCALLGPQYSDYAKQVPRFIPRVFHKTSADRIREYL